MTDHLYNSTYEWCVPRDYHYFEVYFKVYNKYTCEYNTITYYISTKFTDKWLKKVVCIPSLPKDVFEYHISFKEVQDRDDIVFHHITNHTQFDSIAVKYFLLCCGTRRWKLSVIKKLKSYFHKYSERRSLRSKDKLKFQFS